VVQSQCTWGATVLGTTPTWTKPVSANRQDATVCCEGESRLERDLTGKVAYGTCIQVRTGSGR